MRIPLTRYSVIVAFIFGISSVSLSRYASGSIRRRVLGASPTKALFSVIIPQILPGIISGFLLSVTLSLDDYIIAAYTKPDSFQTISTHIYGLDKNNIMGAKIKAAYWAFTAIIFLLIVVVVIVSNIIAYRKTRSKKR